jgi:iron(III) transport system ATP-binding protein
VERIVPDVVLENLTKRYGDTTVLDDVGFAVGAGELFTLLGPSGCGKTTTLLSIAGFITPERGVICCGDDVLLDAGRRRAVPVERRGLGMVFQSYAIWPHLSVAENVAFPLRVRRVGRAARRARVDEALELVELGGMADRYPHQLSGGQRQRVALARALVYQPRLLLLDEPFSNLDAKLRERARAWLRELQQHLGLTTLFVTHDQDEALEMSDRILVMDGGRVQQVGTPEEIYRRPVNEFVATFVGRCNLLRGTVVERVGDGVLRVSLVGGAATMDVSGAGHAPGAAVTIAVRPEALRVSPAGDRPAGANTLDGELRAATFLGDHYRCELRCGSIDLVAQTDRPVAGRQVTVHVPPEACFVLGAGGSPQRGDRSPAVAGVA